SEYLVVRKGNFHHVYLTGGPVVHWEGTAAVEGNVVPRDSIVYGRSRGLEGAVKLEKFVRQSMMSQNQSRRQLLHRLQLLLLPQLLIQPLPPLRHRDLHR